MNSKPLHEELLALLPRRRGHFRLESGHHGDLWLDLDSLFLRPARLRRFAAALALPFTDLAIEAVCGPLEGIAHLPSELWRPEACPLCAAQAPLEDGARLRPLIG